MSSAEREDIESLHARIDELTRRVRATTATVSRLRRAIRGIVDRNVLGSLDPTQIRKMLADGVGGLTWRLDETSPRETWTTGNESVVIPHPGSWNRVKDVATAIRTLARLRGVLPEEVLADMLPDEDGSQ